ncbi:MAG: hypothetical protein J0L92_07360 [Deltaproteobacteria bacterium]|nr:hypothetical protein [Deltaproteobacteria bacterium]
MTDTPTAEPISIRSHVRRALAVVSLILASVPLAAGSIVLGWALFADVSSLATVAGVLGADDVDLFSKILGVIWGVGLLFLLGVLAWAIPIWLGGMKIFGTLVLDVKGRRTASATTLLACAGCDALGALMFLAWHHFAPSTPYVLGVAVANVVGAVVCVVVVGIAHARGTEAG